MMHKLVILCALSLIGCTTVPPVIAPSIVITPCMKVPPVRPAYVFSTSPKPTSELDAAILVQNLYLDFQSADLYGRQWELAAAGCI
jgi:hypothetical protein